MRTEPQQGLSGGGHCKQLEAEGHLSYASGIIMGNIEHERFPNFGEQGTASGNVVVDIKALPEFRGGALISSREIGKSKAEPLILNRGVGTRKITQRGSSHQVCDMLMRTEAQGQG